MLMKALTNFNRLQSFHRKEFVITVKLLLVVITLAVIGLSATAAFIPVKSFSYLEKMMVIFGILSLMEGFFLFPQIRFLFRLYKLTFLA
jgi:hypothetical protein